jgi:hypothetical protein
MSSNVEYIELKEGDGSKQASMLSEGRSSRLMSEGPNNRTSRLMSEGPVRESLAELSRSSLFMQAGIKQSELRESKFARESKLHPRNSEFREDSMASALGPEPASTNSAIFNLSNTILGTGVLTMPYACNLCGILVFLILLCIVTTAVIWSLRFLLNALEAPKDSSEATYKNTTTVLCGATIAAIVDWSMILTLLGTCVAYVNIIGALLPPIFALAATSPDSFLCGGSGILLWQTITSVSRFRVWIWLC